MSDLAVIDLDAPEQPATTKPYAIVGPFRNRDAGTDATLAALQAGLPGAPSVIAGPAPRDTTATVIDVNNKRAIGKAISDVEAVVVVAPDFGADFATTSYLARLAYKARLRGQVVAFINASAVESPNNVSTWLSRTAVHNADLTVMRDERSADALVAAGVDPPIRIGADPAWAELGQLFAAPQQEDNVVVALDERTSPEFISGLATALTPVAASGVQVILQPWGGHSKAYASVAERVAERVGGNTSVINAPSTLREARDVYSTSRAVLALRSTAVMAAASSGSRTLAFGDADMGRLASVLDLPVVSSNAAPVDVASALLKTLEHGAVGSRAVPQLIDRAKASIDLVRLLLTEGGDISQSANNPLPLYPNPWR